MGISFKNETIGYVIKALTPPSGLDIRAFFLISMQLYNESSIGINDNIVGVGVDSNTNR